jgi:hypothetical protein
MKIHRVVIRLAPITLIAVALTVSAAEMTRTQTLIKAAQTALEELKHNNFDRVEARFDSRMSEALPLDKLPTTWQTIIEQVGAIGACKEAKTSERDGYLVVVLPCEAANMPIDAQFAYDADNKIAGMFIRPSAAPAG